MTIKKRLDIAIVERNLAPSREKARAMIMAGEVFVNGARVDKPGFTTKAEDVITVVDKPRFVSRGGDKLNSALDDFGLDVRGRISADVGASTGGFTDCLLQRGVARVYAIDVGYGQLAYSLRLDERVRVIERTNARYLPRLDEPINLVVMDVSFISVRLLLPVLQGWLYTPADLVILIKPQFEAGRGDVGKGGVVRDSRIHQRVLYDVLSFAAEQSFLIHGLTISPIKGPAGNTEFFIWLGWHTPYPVLADVDSAIERVLSQRKFTL